MEHEREGLELLERLAKIVGFVVMFALLFWIGNLVSIPTFLGIMVLSIVLALANYFEGRAKGQLDKLNENE